MTIYVYSSLCEITALVRHLLDGQSAFNSTTRPTVSEVRMFMERASNELNVALAGEGFSVPITNQVAKSACDNWVTMQAAFYAELTQRGVGFNGEEGTRLAGINHNAHEFAKQNAKGFQLLGASRTTKLSSGIAFTGETAPADRSDPDDTSLAQPKFRRGLFDDPAGSGAYADDDEAETDS